MRMLIGPVSEVDSYNYCNNTARLKNLFLLKLSLSVFLSAGGGRMQRMIKWWKSACKAVKGTKPSKRANACINAQHQQFLPLMLTLFWFVTGLHFMQAGQVVDASISFLRRGFYASFAQTGTGLEAILCSQLAARAQQMQGLLKQARE
jgi:hypothetical protein